MGSGLNDDILRQNFESGTLAKHVTRPMKRLRQLMARRRTKCERECRREWLSQTRFST
jgi:hypothetical protein